MAKNYNVIDARTMELVYFGLNQKELCKFIGIKSEQVSKYVEEGKAFKGEYQIQAVELESNKERFIREWQEITDKLKKYKYLDRIILKMSENGG